ncbi:uncharacterized protein DEA37_0005502 [Paragonimus westermani]|uniref:Uncharacterized protein n=1 Tax=Paragonimus westermani TaxID=34504 RepID=A0A5J4N5H0_9TREM|nr:uncharacterized protein DEA37_0005502 [Paragonimus westermani]
MFTSKRGTLTGFFLAGRFMSWLPVFCFRSVIL